jgi:hypothetical protein
MMLRITIFLCCILLSRVQGDEIIFDFTKTPAGQLPDGFTAVTGGEGAPGAWKLVSDEVPSAIGTLSGRTDLVKRTVLAQVSEDPTDERFPMLVYTNLVLGDFTFTTRFKCVSGKVEQMAGIVFRYQDEKNYYYVRASAKGNTFRFFKVVAGQRSAPIGPEFQIPAGQWHELKVQCKQNQIFLLLNEQQIIPTLTDNSFPSGMVGFWTKSDSVSHFSDARLDFIPLEPLARKLLRKVHDKYPRVLGMRVYAQRRGSEDLKVLASTREEELGMAGGEAEKNVLEQNTPYFGKLKKGVVVSLPLHDRNGEVVGVLRVEMTTFIGQTENNAVARALPIAKDIEFGIIDAKDLF